jgi:5,10-methenyltetrahydromethanopterin hydrogenase
MEGKGVDKEPNVLEKIADAINSGAILAQTMTDLQGKWLEKEKIMFYAAKCVGLGMLRVQTLIKKQSQTWITKKEKEVEWIKLPH